MHMRFRLARRSMTCSSVPSKQERRGSRLRYQFGTHGFACGEVEFDDIFGFLDWYRSVTGRQTDRRLSTTSVAHCMSSRRQ